MSFSFFVDGLKVGEHYKLTLEDALVHSMQFNHTARNSTSARRERIFIQDQKLFRYQKYHIRNDQAQDYHHVIKRLIG